jgi:Na+/H+ antiporter NhaD/arsenite permease-like protein
MDSMLNNSVTGGAVIAALLIFLGSYSIIISERIHRTIVAIFGASLMVLFGIFLNFYNQELAIEAIDFNTIGLLIGMMVIVGVTKDTGIFQYVAIKSAKMVKGNPWKILLAFSVITALSSALLDNVTTVLLMTPMILVICDNLRVSPMPFLLMEIFMSNIGGTATLIGDPPNILIGSAAKLSFMDFLINLGPVILVILVVFLFVARFFAKNKITATQEAMDNIMKLNENDSIRNPVLLKKSIFVLCLVILGFLVHGALHIEAATIAILGASLLLFLDNKNPERALHEVEWVTIFFFSGLFVLVGGLEQVGIIDWAAGKIISFTDGNLLITSIAVLWGGAFFSAFIDNIPFVATMIPMVHEMGTVFSDLKPIWWALSLGACLGGNGTLIGASANLVVAGMAEKAGYKISFLDFLKLGLKIMIVTVFVANIYLLLRYF